MATPTMITIPPRTRVSICRGKSMGGTCDEGIFIVMHPSTGKPHPVSVRCEGGTLPGLKETEVGQGVSHFSNCADVELFRNWHKKKPPTLPNT